MANKAVPTNKIDQKPQPVITVSKPVEKAHPNAQADGVEKMSDIASTKNKLKAAIPANDDVEIEKEKVVTNNKGHSIAVENLSKSFVVGEQTIQILHDISVEIEDSEFVIIVGPSGSGKSTLMHIMLGLEEPSEGTVKFYNSDIYAGKNEDDRSDFRKKYIGMVYQQPHWIRALNVIENIAFPLYLLGHDKNHAHDRALKVLSSVNLQDWATYLPTELSSGQQQRISLARALVTNPMVIFADEPTGNLDFSSGQHVMQLLKSLSTDDNKTIVMVTHDLEYLKYADTAIHIFDGKIAGIYRGKNMEKLVKVEQMKRGIQDVNSRKVTDNHDSKRFNSGTNVKDVQQKQTDKSEDKQTIQTPTQLPEQDKNIKPKKGLFGGLFGKSKKSTPETPQLTKKEVDKVKIKVNK